MSGDVFPSNLVDEWFDIHEQVMSRLRGRPIVVEVNVNAFWRASEAINKATIEVIKEIEKERLSVQGEIKIGDIVRLRGADVALTVLRIGDGNAECSWFVGEELKHYIFPLQSLTFVKG